MISLAKKTILEETHALQNLHNSIDEKFSRCIELIEQTTGRLVVTGIGKSALVAQKMVATLNSTGTRSLFMHAADAVHGDLGMIDDQDIVICISKSGETAELKVLVPILQKHGIICLAMTSNLQSFLAQKAQGILYTPVDQEAEPNNLAPTSSTIVQAAMGDAVASVLIQRKGFTPAHFARYHPGGSLGKQLYLKVMDASAHNGIPSVKFSDGIRHILLNMSQHRLGATVVVDEDNKVQGIITDGDIRRWYQEDRSSDEAFAKNIMTKNPMVIESNSLAMHAFDMMRSKNIHQLPIVEKEKYVGMIHMQDLIKEGIGNL